VKVDGGGVFRPAVSTFGTSSEAVGTPAIDSGLKDDVYLTLDTLPQKAGGPVTIGVTIQPLVIWLWLGGAVLIIGSAIAVVPVGRKRRSGLPAMSEGEAGHPDETTDSSTHLEVDQEDSREHVEVPVS
jgi:cytochrome c-type biogenesis protein CcmF